MKMKMLTATVLAIVSLNAAANCTGTTCPIPAWPAGTVQGQQQQAQNQTVTQSPTMVMSGSNTVNNITSDLPSASGVTISNDGGFTFNGSCPTTQLFVGVNGDSYLIQRGMDVKVPKAVAEVLEHSQRQDELTAARIAAAENAAQ